MQPSEDIRIICDSLQTVAEESRLYFQTKGFVVEEQHHNGKLRISSKNQPMSVWHLLIKGIPGILSLNLRCIHDDETEVRLQVLPAPDFRRSFFGALTALFLLMQCCYWSFAFFSSRKDLFAFFVCTLAVLIGFSVGIAWWLLIVNLSDRLVICENFYSTLQKNLGVKIRIVQINWSAPDLPLALICSFACFVLLLAPFWRNMVEHFVVWIVGGVIIFSMIGCIPLVVKRKVVLKHCVHCLINFAAAVALAVYGLLPAVLSIALVVAFEALNTHSIRTQMAQGTAIILTGLFLFIPPLWVFPAFLKLGRSILDLALSVKTYQSHPEAVADIDQGKARATKYMLLLFWLVVGSILYVGLYASLSMVEVCLRSESVWFPFWPSELMWAVIHLLAQHWIKPINDSLAIFSANFVVMLYTAPFLCGFLYLLARNLRGIWEYCRKRWIQPSLVHQIEPIISRMSQFAGVKPPLARLKKSDAIEAFVEIPALPGCRCLLVISSGALKQFSPEQLESVLAHEIGHLKWRHVPSYALFNFLSRWTLLGEGFLTAWVRESTYLEKEADAFAVSWLERKESNFSRKDLVDALGLLEKQRISLLRHEKEAAPMLAVNSYEWGVDLAGTLARYPHESRLGKIKILLRLSYTFYFHGWQTSYQYLPYKDRIGYIKNLPN